MTGYHDGYRLFVYSIFERALLDVVAAPHASTDPEMKYKKQSHLYDSADAKRFISIKNDVFNLYCSLIDLDPSFAEKALLHRIDEMVENPELRKSLFKGIFHDMS